MQTVDARGLSCPEPVLLTQAALASGESSYVILVGSATAKERVTQYAQSQGYTVSVVEEGEEFTLTLQK